MQVVSKGNKILGATIVAAQAGDLIAEFVLAMTHGLSLKQVPEHDSRVPHDDGSQQDGCGPVAKEQRPGRNTEFLGAVVRFFALKRPLGPIVGAVLEGVVIRPPVA